MKTKILKKYPGSILTYSLASLISLIVPILFGYLIDTIIIGKQYSQLNAWFILAITIALISSLSTFYFVKYIPVKKGIENTINLQANSLKSVLKMTVPSFEKKDKGYYYNVIMNSTASYGDLHEELFLKFIGNLFCIAAILGFIFYTSMIFGILFLIYIPLIILLSISQSKSLFKMQKDAMELQDGWLSSSKSIIESKKEINALHAEGFFLNLFIRKGENWLNYILKYRFFQNIVEYIPTFLNNIYSILFLVIGARMVQQGNLSAGMLIIGYQYLSYLVAPVSESTNILIRYLAGKEHIHRVDHLDELSIVPKETSSLNKSETMLFETSKFTYQKGEKDTDLLYDLDSLSLELGKFYVIKGDNGSGKSMFLNLMLGNISLAHSQGTFTLAKHIEDTAYLTYPLFFLNGTFEENLFNRNYDPALLEILNIDFEEKIITANPVNLSFGQQQKIALLRVLSMDKPILFLDEPFSNLDRNTQSKLVEYFKELKHKKTMVCIMHDESLDEICDSILYIKNKRLEYKQSV
ncbi:ABC transporter transmembrane domain-containing protein [Saccharibacillus alkalitolerans]|uniref:ABC transporter ATP-binding protein n=1 Tax=Saccharibacillus alkalitolerans TaxID=2705290 RepID=A0ABX0FA57_9BACL|nr:ABC transporter ATP-binding protein [Saccharibacillus alkalitolerans]NGZ77188.1 ABC transporter ATP-binding protein [Saccharibacillus alkalitolerans]